MLGIVNHLCVLPCLNTWVYVFKFSFLCVCAYVQESSLLMLQASLKGELEGNQQQLESSKVTEPALPSKTSLCNPFWRNMQFYKSTFDQQIEVCELTAERHRLQEQLRSALEQQQRTSSSLQQCINGLQQERDTAKVYTHTHTFNLSHTLITEQLHQNWTRVKCIAQEHISSSVWNAVQEKLPASMTIFIINL